MTKYLPLLALPRAPAEISNRTSMTPDDIISTLQTNNMLFRDEETSQHVILINRPVIQTHHERMEAKGYPKIKPDNLTWSPFVLTRSMMRTVSAGGTAAAAAANGDGGREVKEEEMDDEDDVKIEGAGRMEKKEEKAKMKGNGEMLKKLRSRK
ncbi:hypothetical protein BC937DRAFT_93851 [Endogone sp. FLAS-F59071]|nr:hypothetical protein BC937DRAFT_93851 [Endogone sp. FLAS-F59071]|eukprot:RUS21006.1 hypothetical protein BC937DRAFT_93851 [Endogone sp. FLAS-F59071]